MYAIRSYYEIEIPRDEPLRLGVDPVAAFEGEATVRPAKGGRVFDRGDLAELTEWARAQVADPAPAAMLRGAVPREAEGDRLTELEEQADSYNFV